MNQQTQLQEIKTPTRPSYQNNQSKFQCNICLQDPLSPMITRCGHIYCWRCIYGWLQQVTQSTHQCPVCKAGISQQTLIPIYSRTDSSDQREQQQNNQNIPPRPLAERLPPQRNNQQNLYFGQGPGINLVMGYGLYPGVASLAINQWDKIKPPTDGRVNDQHHSQKGPARLFVVVFISMILVFLFCGSDAHYFV